jgi:hypothetical protein
VDCYTWAGLAGAGELLRAVGGELVEPVECESILSAICWLSLMVYFAWQSALTRAD